MLKLTLFGSPQASLPGEQAVQFATSKTEALLYYLVLTGKAHSRHALAGLLWPDANEVSARKNLRDALYGLRRRLDDYLIADHQILVFNRALPYFLDVETFRATVTAAPEQRTTAELQAAVDLYQGELLAGFAIHANDSYEEWLRLEREHLRMLAVRAMHLLTARYLDDANWGAGLEITQRLLILDSYDEAAHRQRMRMLAACGQYGAAVAQYEQCRQLLETEVGVSPSRETQTLLMRIREGQQAQPLTVSPILPSLPSLPWSTATAANGPPAWPATAPTVIQTDLQFDDGDLFRNALFLGRNQELTQLNEFLTVQRMRLVTVLGMGGQGKTTLAGALVFRLTNLDLPAIAQPVASITVAAEQCDAVVQPALPPFQRILWRSLRNAPRLNELLHSWLQSMLDPATDYQSLSLEQQLKLLLIQLHHLPYLLILDNFESILDGGEQTGRYREGYEAYAQLLDRIATYAHQSTLLLTSRELPLSYEQLASNPTVATLHLNGLLPTDALQLMQKLSIESDQTALTTLVSRYSGNPLALKLAAQTVQNLFGGSLVTFLQNEALIFDSIRHLLDQQFQRLSALEAEILLWLAIEREAVAPHVIWENFAAQPLRRNFLEALRSLQRRALLEIEETGAGYQPPIRLSLPNFWVEYLTDRLVEVCCEELFQGRFDWFSRYALCKAQSAEYLREVQWRLLVQPVAQRLQSRWRQRTVHQLRQLVTKLHTCLTDASGYAGTNLIHLFLQLNLSMAELDFSQLSLRQADLRHAHLQRVNFADAELSHSIFVESFNGVLALTFSPNGKLLAAATTDGNIYLWNTRDHQLVGIGQGNGRWIWSLAFSPDGQQLASSCADQLVRLWNVAPLSKESSDTFHTLTVHSVLHGHTDTVFTVAFSPDGQQLVSGSADQSIRLWQVATGALLDTFYDHVGPIFSLAFDPTGTLLASAGRDHVVRIWDLATHTLRHHCIGHTEDVIDLCFHYVSATGITWLITGSRDQSVRLWASDSGQLRHTLVDANNEILALAASPGGYLLAASGADHIIRCWDLTTMQLRYSLSGHGDAVRALAFSADGITLASGGNDQTIRLWDTEKRRALYTIQGYKNEISALAISPDGTLLANGNANHVIYLWLLKQHADLPLRQAPTQEPYAEVQPLQTLQGHYGAVRAVAFHPDGTLLASGGDDDSIRLWQFNVDQWGEHQLLRGHTGAVMAIAFSPDGQLLASGSADHTIRLWDLQHTACHIVRGHKKMVNTLAFSPDGQYLASADDGGMLLLHHTSDLMTANKQGMDQALWRMATNNSALFTLAFSPDGQLLALGGAEKTIQLWQISARRLLTSWEGHSSSIYTLAFSPDGRHLASGSGDQQICLWALPTGALRQRWSGHKGLVCALRFDFTGQLLISSSADQTIRLWPIGTYGEPRLLHPPGPYHGMNITGATGLTSAKRAVLKALGAVDQSQSLDLGSTILNNQ